MMSMVTTGNANTNVSTSGSRTISFSSARMSLVIAFIVVLRSVPWRGCC